MSSDDIANLFRQFGGAPDNYKELGRDNVVRQSRERWPLLADVRAQDAAKRVESVRAGEEHSHDGPMPIVFDEAAAAQAAAEARVRAPVTQPAPVVHPAVATAPVHHEHLSAEAAGIVAAALAPAAPPISEPAFAAAPTPIPAPQAVPPAPAVAGTELQGLFSRLARQPEPPAPTVDPEVSLLRRLLKP